MHAKGNRSQNFKSLNNLSLTKKSSRTQTTSHTQHRANVHPDQNWSGKRTKRHTSSSDNTALIASSLCWSPLHWLLREAQPSLPAPAKKGFGRRYSFCSVQPNTLPSNRTRISYCGLVTRPLLCLSYKPAHSKATYGSCGPESWFCPYHLHCLRHKLKGLWYKLPHQVSLSPKREKVQTEHPEETPNSNSSDTVPVQWFTPACSGLHINHSTWNQSR